jgi:iron only hydrogenase large subunit-like protein
MGMNAFDPGTVNLRCGNCISCGNCTKVCLTEALQETTFSAQFLNALGSGKTFIMIVDVSSRVSIGEFFNDPINARGAGLVVSAARHLGFRSAFDGGAGDDLARSQTTAGLRLRKSSCSQRLSLFSSACPAFVELAERAHPELCDHVMPLMPPCLLLAREIRPKFALEQHIRPQDMYVVHLSPCTAVKALLAKPQCAGLLDACFSPREFASLLRRFGVDWSTLKPILKSE